MFGEFVELCGGGVHALCDELAPLVIGSFGHVGKLQDIGIFYAQSDECQDLDVGVRERRVLAFNVFRFVCKQELQVIDGGRFVLLLDLVDEHLVAHFLFSLVCAKAYVHVLNFALEIHDSLNNKSDGNPNNHVDYHDDVHFTKKITKHNSAIILKSDAKVQQKNEVRKSVKDALSHKNVRKEM